MELNRSLHEISRGEWAFHIPSLSTYLPIVADLLQRKAITLPTTQKSSSINFLDRQGYRVSALDVMEGNARQEVVGYASAIGPLMKYSDLCTVGADKLTNDIEMMMSFPNVKGIVLNVDGPGGGVSAVSEFERLAANKTKPIVALVDMCASAHYWASCLVADHIMASNSISACVGSIGVMMSFADNQKYLEEKGIVFHEIYAPQSEHKNLAFKLAREGKYEMIKEEYLSPTAKRFQADVRAARPNLKEEVGVLTGKTFGAEEAKEYGMIDSVGSLKKAIDMVMMLSELKY